MNTASQKALEIEALTVIYSDPGALEHHRWSKPVKDAWTRMLKRTGRPAAASIHAMDSSFPGL